MNKQNISDTEAEIEKKYKNKDKKKKPKMRVDGGGVKKIQQIIVNKSNKI